MSNVVPIPTALKRRDDRVQALCDAVAPGKAVRHLVDAEPYDGEQVMLLVGDLETQWSVAEVLGILTRLVTATREVDPVAVREWLRKEMRR